MKISTLFTIASLTLGAMLIGLVGQTMYQATQTYAQVQQLRDLVALRGIWFQGLTVLSTARSLSQVQISMDIGTDAEVAALRSEKRARTLEIFEEFSQKMYDGKDFGMREELAEDMALALEAIEAAHNRVDAMMLLPLDQRNPQEVVAIIDEIKAKITDMKGMAVHIVAENSITSTQAMLLMRLQETVFDTREHAGRARSLYAIATLHGRSVSKAEMEYVSASLKRAHEAWEGVEHVTETIPVPDSVTAKIAETDTRLVQGFFDKLAVLDAEMETAAKLDTNTNTDLETNTIPVTYNLTFAEFFKTSTEALSAPAELIEATGVELDKIWQIRATEARNVMIFDIITMIAAIGIIGATLWAVSRKITRKLTLSLQDLAALTNGNLDVMLSHSTKDLYEIKELGNGLANLQEKLQGAAQAQADLAGSEAAQKHVVSSLSEGLTELAAGNLAVRLQDRFDPKYQSLADNFNAAIDSLGKVIAQVVETAGTIQSGTRGINEATIELSHRTETQGVTLQNAAAALEQLTRNIVGSQADATELDGLASLASDKGNAMTTTMSQTVEAIEKIKSSSQQIEQIVGVIEDIAFQTNLLALNAGVEATRAGAEGSGFAVIASEVRSLAERSAQSAQDIKNLIAASGVEVAKGVEFVAEAEASVGDIGTHIKMISALISRIALAATEQSQGLVKVNDGVSQLDLVTQTNVAMVEETTAECSSLASVAQDLSQLVARFKIAGGEGWAQPAAKGIAA